MERRKFIQIAGTSAIIASAGCTGNGDGDIQDSDGDGVIDSEDYAPNDPEVQEKSDLQEATTITPTPTENTTQPQTATSNPTTPPSHLESNTLLVDDTYWKNTSHIRSYSLKEVTTSITQDHPETEYDSAKLLVTLEKFPRDTIVSTQLSTSFLRSNGPQEISVGIESNGLDRDTKYNFRVSFVSSDTTSDDLNSSELTTIMETDPFTVTAGGEIERTDYDHELDDDSGETYTRNNVEGAYEIEVSGRTQGKGWEVGFFAYKSSHALARQRSRGRSRPEYVNYELTSGSAKELASLLSDDADSLGYNDIETVDFVIDFVQALPYVPDDVSRGFDDYTKFIMETVPEMGGDCEDTAIMLASILSAEPFGYDMILIQPPGHMAAGIWQEDPGGWHYELDGREYTYIETTGRGWGVGDCPTEYQGEKAQLHQV